MKSKFKPVLFIFGILMTVLYLFQNSEFLTNGITQNIVKDRIAVNDSNHINNSIDESKSLEKVIKDYIEFSGVQDTVNLKKTITKLKNEKNILLEEKKSNKLSKNSSKPQKKDQDSPILKGLSDADYDHIYRRIPEMIYVGKKTFYEISNFKIEEDTANVLVILQNSIGNKALFELNFSLIKVNTGQWKIFQIKHNFSKFEDINPKKHI